MKKARQIIVPAILSVIVLPLLFMFFQKHQTVYTSTSKQETSNHSAKATVIANALNVWERPSMSSQIIGKLKLGTNIMIHAERAGWAKIDSSSGVQGWINESYITKDAFGSHSVQSVAAATKAKTTIGQGTYPNFTTESMEPLKGKNIVLDPGHGGFDDGTTSIVGTNEKALTLPTAKVVKQKLESAGANVLLTRTSDTYIPLWQRAKLSNQNLVDAFISFHYNWSNDPLVNGLTDFYYQKSKDNSLASDIIKEVSKATGLKNDGTHFDDLEVLRNNSQPSTLIELGFLSNKQDDSVVESNAYRHNVAQGIYLGLLDYFQPKNN